MPTAFGVRLVVFEGIIRNVVVVVLFLLFRVGFCAVYVVMDIVHAIKPLLLVVGVTQQVEMVFEVTGWLRGGRFERIVVRLALVHSALIIRFL